MSLVVPILVGVSVLLVTWSVSRAWSRSPLDADEQRRERRLPSRRRMTVAVLAGIAGYLVADMIGAVLGLATAGIARRIGERRATAAARASVDEQLADTIGAVSSAVRAGLSIPQALEYAASEAAEPLRSHLESIVRDIEVGVPLQIALHDLRERIGSEDAALFVSAVELHRRTGGDLPIVLDQIGATIRDRVAAKREVRALTAQARLSGLILGLLPVGFFAFLWMTSRREVQEALGTTTGVLCVGLGLAMEAVAFVWIRKLLEVG